MITARHLPRRTFLRGLGTAIALPMLDSMVPAFAANRLAKSPLRLGFVYVPNGIDMPNWTPKSEGADFDLPHILEPLAPHKDRIAVLSGLTHNGGRALGDGPGDHARAAASFLTGVHPRKTSGADIQVGVSADQVAANAIGGATRFKSLEIGCEDGRLVGNCDSGYSCAYSNSISWASPSTPLPPDINPRSVFERLFGADAGEDPAVRAKRRQYHKSILDFVAEDTRSIEAKVGPSDRRKLDEYLSAVRQIEKRIEDAEKTSSESPAPTLDVPDGIPVDYSEHAQLMFELMLLAYQTDSTRVITMMMGREGSTRAYREIGISDAHHPLTHHRGKEDMIAKVRQINRYHMEQFAWFIGRLKSTPDGDGSLLDHVMIVYGSGLSDGNRHQHNDLPVVVAGNFLPGKHVRYPAETPMANLYMTLVGKVGVKPERIGDSNGELKEL